MAIPLTANIKGEEVVIGSAVQNPDGSFSATVHPTFAKAMGLAEAPNISIQGEN